MVLIKKTSNEEQNTKNNNNVNAKKNRFPFQKREKFITNASGWCLMMNNYAKQTNSSTIQREWSDTKRAHILKTMRETTRNYPG
jgi:hypothetical protein